MRPEDAVDAPRVEADVAQLALQLGDIVTAQVRRPVVQEPVAEAPVRFDERRPGQLVADTIDPQTAGALELPDGIGGVPAVLTVVAARLCEPGDQEPPLQVAYRFAPIADGQWELPRNSSSSWSS